MKYKCTKEDYEYFKRKCLLWIEVLNLWTWKVYFEFEEVEDVIADCTTEYEGRVATIRLNSGKMNIEITKELLNETALHECLELLFAPMMSLAQCRGWDVSEYNRERHSVIRVLEKLLNKH